MIECRNDGPMRAILWFWMWVFLICNYSYFFKYQQIERAEAIFKSQDTKIAALYANPTFHDEVVSSVACTLKDEGFFVVVYIGNGLHVGNVMLPLSGKRQRYSEAFYGSCVDKFVTIYDPIPEEDMVKDPDLLVFVTYPMLRHNFGHDDQAIRLLKCIKDNKSSTSVVLITHRSGEAMHETLPIVESYIPKDKITFVFLGEHTRDTTEKAMAAEQKSTVTVAPGKEYTEGADKDGKSYRLAQFYPVVPMEYIGKSRLAGEAALFDYIASWTSKAAPERSSDGWPMQTFSIQGNFGGKHAHRKDVKGTVTCLQRVENSYEEDSGVADGPMQINAKPEGGKTPLRVGVDLIGHLTEELSLPQLRYGDVRFLSDLQPVDYYRAINRTRFLIAAVGEEEYYESRATSSVPAALITGIPLVASKRFIDMYPCLRDAKVHKMIAKDSECESIAAAARLSDSEYKEALMEVKHCAGVMYQQGRELFAMLAKEAHIRRVATKRKGADAIPVHAKTSAAEAAKSAAAADVVTEKE